jgi:Recombination endonuclease VII
MAEKLKTTGIKKIRAKMLLEQNNTCAICKLACSEDQACLDHMHGVNESGEGGYVRAVLHRGCNAVEGKIINSLRRYGIKDVKAFLTGLLEYHEYHKINRTNLIHPTYFTPEEKIERKKLKVKRAKAKLKALK